MKVADEIKECSPDELRRVLREQAGLDLVALTPAQGGESKSTFWATDRAGTVSVLKVMPGAAQEAAGYLRTLDSVPARLRDRGYPAPRFRAVGRVPGLAFWVQQRMPGAALDLGRGEPDRAALARLLPDLLSLNDAQAGLGTGTRGWPGLLTRTLTAGGDGYCLHSTLQPARPPVTCCRYCAGSVTAAVWPSRPARTSFTTTSPPPTCCPTDRDHRRDRHQPARRGR